MRAHVSLNLQLLHRTGLERVPERAKMTNLMKEAKFSGKFQEEPKGVN